MKKEKKQLCFIIIFILIGCMIGYILGVNQINQLKDPEFFTLLENHNMYIHEPIGIVNSIILCSILFAGISVGIIFYKGIVNKWFTPVAPKILLGIVIFPFYTLAGVIGVIPFIIYTVIKLLKNKN